MMLGIRLTARTAGRGANTWILTFARFNGERVTRLRDRAQTVLATGLRHARIAMATTALLDRFPAASARRGNKREGGYAGRHEARRASGRGRLQARRAREEAEFFLRMQ